MAINPIYSAGMTQLSDIEIQRGLGGLPGWTRKNDALCKAYHFANFPAGIEFIRKVSVVAEEAGHHPDIDIRYTKITFVLSTHDAGGITEKDFALARSIEGLAAA